MTKREMDKERLEAQIAKLMAETAKINATYLHAAENAREKLERLLALTKTHFGYKPQPLNWGHVGDMEKLDADLAEILARFDR